MGKWCRPGSGPSCPCPARRAWRLSWRMMTKPRRCEAIGSRIKNESARAGSTRRSGRRTAGDRSPATPPARPSRRPARPIACGPTGSSTSCCKRVPERVQVVGRHAHAAARLGRGSAAPRCRDRSPPATGRPAARIEYVFDGTLTRPRPAFSGTTWMSPVASTSDSRSIGLVAGEADVGQTGGALAPATLAPRRRR